MYFSHSTDPLRYPTSPASDVAIGPPGVSTRLASGLSSTVASTASSTTPLFATAQTSWPSSLVAGSGVGSSALDSILAGIKRSSESFYYPTVLGAHNMIGLSEAWYSANSLTKRPRYENTSHLPIYPQRPGEKDCAYYMLTRTCKFGESCKFDHPIWVPEGGIPDWKEIPVVTSDSFPVRPGEPDCPYFLKTQTCRFGSKCRFNHPRDKLCTLGDSQTSIFSALPERPSEPPCAFYVKTGTCKFGASCKFHHPKDVQIQLAVQTNGSGEQTESNIETDGVTAGAQLAAYLASNVPASVLNSKGLPIRQGEVDCPFYLKTGSCKYGATCRYNHPDRNAINPALAAIGTQILASPTNLSFGVVTPTASIYQTIDSRLSHSTVGALTTIYPQRPGQTECEYYMKTGTCMFGERCKFHHPVDRTATQGVTLTPAGLPRREGSIMCPYYLKTGTCKFGATCKFDHPPPAEVMTLSSQGTITNPVETKDEDKGA